MAANTVTAAAARAEAEIDVRSLLEHIVAGAELKHCDSCLQYFCEAILSVGFQGKVLPPLPMARTGRLLNRADFSSRTDLAVRADTEFFC